MKFLLPLLLLASLFAGWFAWRSHHQAAVASLALSQLQSARSNTDAHLGQAAERLARAKQAVTALRSRESNASTPKAAPASPAPAPSRARDRSRLVADDPNLQNLQLASRRAQFAITYGPFYRRAALTPAQIATFEENLLRREERQADIMATATAQHADLRDPVYQKLFTDAETDYQSAQKQALGDASHKAFADYERTADTREVVSALASAAAMANAPLDAAQAEHLTRTIADVKAAQLARALADANARATPGEVIYNPPIDWNLVREQSKSFLSASQLTFIDTTESAGPRGMGGRFLPALQAAIQAAGREDAATPNPPASP